MPVSFAEESPTVQYNINKMDEEIFNNNLIPTSHKFEWKTGRWGECSVTCGTDGKKARNVICIDANSKGQERVDEKYCNESLRPVNITNCNEFRCPQWNFGQFSEVTSKVILMFFYHSV